jgi:hypothetical protein
MDITECDTSIEKRDTQTGIKLVLSDTNAESILDIDLGDGNADKERQVLESSPNY